MGGYVGPVDGQLGPGGFGGPGAVGYMPQITQLFEGASTMALAIISADRRYVRISQAPSSPRLAM